LKNNVWIFLSILIFFLGTRLFIIHGYGLYWTDVGLYFEKALVGIKGGYTAYHDFWWPYPPLTLPIIYLPILFFPDIAVFRQPYIGEYVNNYISSYRTVFQYEMLVFDIVTLTYVVLFLKNRFRTSNIKITFAIFFYSVLGLLAGHLIYDRLDIVITAVFMASVYHFTSEKRQYENRIFSYLIYLAGSLFKLLPLLWWPVYVISDCFGESCKDKKETGLLHKLSISKIQLKRALMPFLIIVIPFIIIMSVYNRMTVNEKTQKGMFTYMGEHGERGIQMESTWATPMMICNAYRKSHNQPIPFPLVTNFGAQHFDEESVNNIYLLLSKYGGFLSLALIYVGFFLYFLVKKEKRGIVNDPGWILTFLVFAVFFIISTQRVLSSQYIIWPMAGITVLIFSSAKRRTFLLILTGPIFLLSYIGFDLGYDKYIEFDPWIVAAVTVRNILLIWLTAVLLVKLIPKSEKK